MKNIKVISFDVEGTLVTTDFSYAIWFDAIPRKYAIKHGISIEQAKQTIIEEYEKIGDQRLEWYDINYWFRKFELGSYRTAMQEYQNLVCYYPEVIQLLSSLNNHYQLIATSGSPREFLQHLLQDIRHYFHRVFSSVSDYRQTKTEEFYRQLCQELNVMPEQIVHIGDNWEFDYINASAIGLKAFFIDRKCSNNKPGALVSLTELSKHIQVG